MTPDNPKRIKYLGYAVKNLTRCSKENDLVTYTLTVLLYLSVKEQNASGKLMGTTNLKE